MYGILPVLIFEGGRDLFYDTEYIGRIKHFRITFFIEKKKERKKKRNEMDFKCERKNIPFMSF